MLRGGKRMEVHGRKGDTLQYYSQLFTIPYRLILDSNPHIQSNDDLNEKRVKIPGYTTITVNKDRIDSISEISSKYNISTDALLLVNNKLTGKKTEQSISIPKKIKKPLIYKKAYTYEQLCNDLQELKEQFPFIKINIIGRSVLGKEIYEIQAGKGMNCTHYNAAFHANEWITSAILMKWLNEWLLQLNEESNSDDHSYFNLYLQKRISVVPMVNPDGVNLVLNGIQASDNKYDVKLMNDGKDEFTHWKANIRGVDLNNQFPANWDIEKERKIPKEPYFRDYPGDQPLTEPEAIAMHDLVKENHFDKVIALHSQGKEIYWGYEGYEPSHACFIAQCFEKMSGYKAIQYVDSHAGFKDWFIQAYRKPGFTLELGKGINPLPLSQFDDIYRDTAPILYAGIYL